VSELEEMMVAVANLEAENEILTNLNIKYSNIINTDKEEIIPLLSVLALTDAMLRSMSREDTDEVLKLLQLLTQELVMIDKNPPRIMMEHIADHESSGIVH